MSIMLAVIKTTNDKETAGLEETVEQERRSIAVLSKAEEVQNDLTPLLDNANKASSVYQVMQLNASFGDRHMEKFSARNQGELQKCTKASASFYVGAKNVLKIKEIRQESVGLSDEDQKHINNWLASADDAASGVCHLAWYRIDDANYNSALASKVLIDKIIGSRKSHEEVLTSTEERIQEIKNKKFILF